MSLLAKIVKKILPFMPDWTDGTIDEQRARQENALRFAKFPADTDCRPVDADGIPAEWIETPETDFGVLFYLHGGAYAIGSIKSHRKFVAQLAHATRLRGLVINYRLAPEHPHPAALEDAVTAYRWLLAEGVDPSQIIIAGDSAGGGLTLATLATLRDAGDALPAGAVCFSPWADLTNTAASFQSKAKDDSMLSFDKLEMYAAYYADEQDRTSPYISPLYADFSGFPPLLIHVGADEVLLDDSTRVAVKAEKAGVDVILEIWDGLFHVFPMLSFLPETKKVVESVAEFAAGCVGDKRP